VLDENEVVDRRWTGRDEFFEVSWPVPRAKYIPKAEVKGILVNHYRFNFLVNLLACGEESWGHVELSWSWDSDWERSAKLDKVYWRIWRSKSRRP
jgi:hypothetical protein